METSGNGKMPKTPGIASGTSTTTQQQNGSAAAAASTGSGGLVGSTIGNRTGGTGSIGGGGGGVHHQNGSSAKHRTSKISTTGIGGPSVMGGPATPSSSTSSSLPTPGASSTAASWPQFRFATTLPLRILVLKDLVGAIIGRGGGTIRQITQETHARVDVHRKESSSANENIIMIYGNPDNCSQACRRILEVMQQEAKSLNRPDEIQLKILASNNLIGRIIGKGGNTIRRIMQQTDTKITINSANLASQYQLERIISISGQLESMCKAEVMISQKLRQCFESDCMQYQQSLMYHHPTGFHHSSLPPSSLLTPGQSATTGPLGIPYSLGPGSHPQQQPQPMSYPPLGASPTCTNIPPSALIGRSSAVMGSSSVTSPTTSATGPVPGGSQPHQLPSSSTQGPAATTAFYNPYNFAPFMYSPHGPQSSFGAPTAPFIGAGSGTQNVPSPYMSTYLYSSMLPNLDNVKETVTIYIPNSVVGAIIGRGGSTIREMMNNSGAVIKVAQMNEEDTSSSTAIESSSSAISKPLERRVTIYGNAFSQNQAQFFVFQKVYTELSNQLSMTASPATICPYGDPAILKVEIMVPTNQVRRIIGKGGSVITELQRTSGATIKLSKESRSDSTTSSTSSSSQPTITTTATTTVKSSVTSPEEPSSPNGGDGTTVTEKLSQQHQQPLTSSSSTTTISEQQQDQTSVFIIGDFYSSFNAQRQIRFIVHRSITAPSSSSSSTTATAPSTLSVPSSATSTTTSSQPLTTTTTTTTTTASSSELTTKSSVESQSSKPSDGTSTIKDQQSSSSVDDTKTSSTTTVTTSAIISSTANNKNTASLSSSNIATDTTTATEPISDSTKPES